MALRLLRAREVAEILGVSRAQAYKLIRLGQIPSVRLSERVVRVPADALEELVRARTRGGEE